MKNDTNHPKRSCTGYIAVLACLLTFVCGTSFAQEKEASKRTEHPSYSRQELQLEYIKVKNDAHQIYSTARALQGRQMRIVADGQKVSAPNLQLVGNSILVYETPAGMKRVIDVIKSLDKALSTENEAKSDLEFASFRLVYASTHTAEQAIKAVLNHDLTSSSQRRSSVTSVPKIGVIHVRARAKEMKLVREIIPLLDQKDQQVTMTCLLIQGNETESTSGLPSDLIANLSKLTNFNHFKLLTSGMVRTSTNSIKGIGIDMAEKDFSANFMTKPGTYNRSSKTLNFHEISLRTQTVTRNAAGGGKKPGSKGSFRSAYPLTQSFSTSGSISADQYTVIGAFGMKPIFVVLKMVVHD